VVGALQGVEVQGRVEAGWWEGVLLAASRFQSQPLLLLLMCCLGQAWCRQEALRGSSCLGLRQQAGVRWFWSGGSGCRHGV
jgi:hypothetical protein